MCEYDRDSVFILSKNMLNVFNPLQNMIFKDHCIKQTCPQRVSLRCKVPQHTFFFWGGEGVGGTSVNIKRNKNGKLQVTCIMGFPNFQSTKDVWGEKSNHENSFTISLFKGPYADHILIPQGSTGSSIFLIPNKPIFFWLQIQNFSFKFFVVLEI